MMRFFTPRSIGQRFALAIGTAAGGILIVLAVANFLNGRELLLDQASREAGKEASNQMGNWDDLVERIAIYPTLISSTQLDTADRGGVTLHWLASLLNTCPIPAVYALYMRLDDSDWQKPGRGVNRKNTPKPIQLRYDFHDPDQDWYRGAKEKKGIYVTLPYFDEGGSDIDMISITKAVHDPSGKFIGVAVPMCPWKRWKKSSEKWISEDLARIFSEGRKSPPPCDAKKSNLGRIAVPPILSPVMVP